MNENNNTPADTGIAPEERLSTGDLILRVATVAIVAAAVYSLVAPKPSECVGAIQPAAEEHVKYAPSGVAIPSQAAEDRVERNFAGTQLDASRGLVMPSQMGWKLKSPYVNND